ncbi:signal recognition particle-docking protein FtsY [Mangrovibacter plantisponsor]|uniref:Signal recognition particle receptor FtsY n=1 Tax=Mangrovibacter plantisponsor TaxID=451513 RepID=A0A317PP21_9ENTR|nr:signal recognition particle-docking protein FtsY [Mangrovibacter plantisponsor]PWW02966.1 signal recognition particle-docking protein FtsY [Mangrovibacter plantisponsor]
MAKEKKRGLFSWLGFGQKAAEEEQKQDVAEQDATPRDEDAAAALQASESAPGTEQAAEPEAATPAEDEHARNVAEPEAESETSAPAELASSPDTASEEHVVEEEAVEEDVDNAGVEHSALVAQSESTGNTVLDETGGVEQIPQAVQLPAEAEAEAEIAVAQQAAGDVDTGAEAVSEPVEQEKPTKDGFFARLKRSLVKTRQNLGSGFISLFRGKKIDDDLFEELEEQLLIADVGVETTRKIITNLTEGASRKQLRDAEALYGLLKEEMAEILVKVDRPLDIEGKTPFVILMVGVNGVGKTTTIGKLARQFQQQGKSVMLAAGDTFRAAAVEQLQVWGQRNDIPVIAQHTGADSASVIFDAIQAAKARHVDVLIADTAGRLQNKAHLMEELKKIVRVMKKLDENAPHEVMLTIDASTGQNAVSQTKLFHEAVGLSGITLTKLDGTAKGGVIFSVADQYSIPIRYIGVGERIEDLRPFKADDFIEALFARED